MFEQSEFWQFSETSLKIKKVFPSSETKIILSSILHLINMLDNVRKYFTSKNFLNLFIKDNYIHFFYRLIRIFIINLGSSRNYKVKFSGLISENALI